MARVFLPSTYGRSDGLKRYSCTHLSRDQRNISAPTLSLVESHTDTVTSLQLHPNHPNLLLSSSTDGLINIFDTSERSVRIMPNFFTSVCLVVDRPACPSGHCSKHRARRQAETRPFSLPCTRAHRTRRCRRVYPSTHCFRIRLSLRRVSWDKNTSCPSPAKAANLNAFETTWLTREP